MSRLSKAQSKAHRQALELVALRRDLTEEEREFVLNNYQEAQTATHNLAGAFFTPGGLARSLRIELTGTRIIDLCAGIGTLSYWCRDEWIRGWEKLPPREFVCVEQDPEYVRVGRKVMPEATWIEADVLALPGNLGGFDAAISNPPFGPIARSGNGGAYNGRRFEYHVIEAASRLARRGVFIIPQQSAPFRYSGLPTYTRAEDAEYHKFVRQTGIELGNTCGIDTTSCQDEDAPLRWHLAKPPVVEIVLCQFDPPQAPAATDAAAPTLTAPEPPQQAAQSALW